MKHIKLLFLLAFFTVTSFTQTPQPAKETPPPAQKTISDTEKRDETDLMISSTFPERRIVGKVIGVYDGDTATVLDADKIQYKFRLSGIDAPEFSQDFGTQSKKNLSDLIFGKTVTVVYNKMDQYGRFVGTIFSDGTDVNLKQIKAGLAWHYKEYAKEQSKKDREKYSEAEVKAKDDKKGLWTMENPVPPWSYRSTKNAASKSESKEREAASTEPVKKTEQGGRTYILGPRGGCYYINDNGKKVYVKDKSLCEN